MSLHLRGRSRGTSAGEQPTIAAMINCAWALPPLLATQRIGWLSLWAALTATRADRHCHAPVWIAAYGASGVVPTARLPQCTSWA